jgi:hypothetical protein
MDKLYELIVDDENTDEVFAISLVSTPAIQSDFLFFNKEQIKFASVNEEKRMLIGPILIPDKRILRVDGEGNPYHVFFSKQTVEKLAQNYLKKKYVGNATLEHDKKLKGVHLVESWVKEGKLDKSNNYGLNLPEGSWVGKFYIDESKEGNTIWNDYVKTGLVKGFSVEALMEHKLIKASLEIDLLEKDIVELSDLEANIVLKKIRQMFEDTFSDYGDGVRNNAKRALEWADENGWGSCGTPVGKQRANQLAKGEAISIDTIQRMHSFLSRHEQDLESSTSYGDGCGKLMYDAWGGKAALGWSRNKLRELGLIEAEAQPSISSSYPGESAKKNKYIHPALIGTNK